MRQWDSSTVWDDPRITWDQAAPPLWRVIELRTNIALHATPNHELHLIHKAYVDEALAALLGGISTEIAALRAEVTALNILKTYPLTFAFGGTPVVNSMINVPLIHDLSVPANLAGARYYNATNPLVASQFTLSRITAAGAISTIGTIDISTGGVATFSGAGSSVLVTGDRLRVTAVTIGGSLTNVAITIPVTRR